MRSKNPNARHPLLDRLYLTFVAGWYSTSDPTSKDRCRHLACTYMGNIIATMIGSTYLSGLLLLMNADDSFIGLTAIISNGATVLQLFSPILLERFPKRKKLLTTLRAVAYFFNIIFIGLVPLFPMDQQGQLTVLALSILVVNLITAVGSPGLSVWHIQYIPERIRKNYFSLIYMTVGVVTALFDLAASRVVDLFKAADMEYQGLLALRGFALVLAVGEIFLYFRMTEQPYEKSESTFALKDMLLPFHNRSYLLNILCVALWNFSLGIPGSYHMIYMLRDVGTSYSYLTLVSLLCTAVSFLVTPFWNKLINRVGWFRMLALAIPLYTVSYLGFAFTAKATVYLYAVACLIGSVVGVAAEISFSGIPYAGIPEHRSTVYIALYSTLASCASLLGAAVGRRFMLATEGRIITVLGMPMVNNQYLLLLSCAMLVLSGIGVGFVARAKEREAAAQ